jgi:hypothetical protein
MKLLYILWNNNTTYFSYNIVSYVANHPRDISENTLRTSK